MSEENKQEKAQEKPEPAEAKEKHPKPEDAAKQEPKQEKAKEPAVAKEAAPAVAGEEGAKKKRLKIHKMSLHDVEAKLKLVEEKMGGLQSKYARSLLIQKEELTRSSKS